MAHLLFRGIFLLAALFAALAGVAILGSFLLPDRAPQGIQFRVISWVAACLFLFIAAVLLGIDRHLSCLARELGLSAASGAARRSLSRLRANLILGGIVAASVLGLAAYAILPRIDQGFAVFG